MKQKGHFFLFEKKMFQPFTVVWSCSKVFVYKMKSRTQMINKQLYSNFGHFGLVKSERLGEKLTQCWNSFEWEIKSKIKTSSVLILNKTWIETVNNWNYPVSKTFSLPNPVVVQASEGSTF